MPAFRHQQHVRFADIDHAGIVYYPRFFHYFHLTFEEFFAQRIGRRAYVELLDQQRIGFPTVSASCEYKSPLRFGDSFEVAMSVSKLGDRSLTLDYEVTKLAESKRVTDGGDPNDPAILIARGANTSAVVNLGAFRAVELPQPLRELFAQLRP